MKYIKVLPIRNVSDKNVCDFHKTVLLSNKCLGFMNIRSTHLVKLIL